jgi:hypothetical protein
LPKLFFSLPSLHPSLGIAAAKVEYPFLLSKYFYPFFKMFFRPPSFMALNEELEPGFQPTVLGSPKSILGSPKSVWGSPQSVWGFAGCGYDKQKPGKWVETSPPGLAMKMKAISI